MRQKFLLPYLFIFALFCVHSVSAQPKSLPDYKFQSLYLYNFTRYISWPAPTKDNQMFVGVLGDSAIYKEIKQFVGEKKTLRGEAIVVALLQNLNQISDQHIVFLPSKSKFEVGKVSKKIGAKSILLVSEQADGIKKGSTIDLVRKDGSLKVYLNKKRAAQSKLKFDDQFLKLCTEE